MLGRFALGFGRTRQGALTAGKVAFAVSLLAGCSSVPDAVNPVAWFSSKDEPAVASPVPGKGADTTKTADSSRDLAKGLPADRSNSKYAEPVRREVAPTKPLARRTPAPTDTQVAAAPEAKVPPKPAVTTQELPPPPASTQLAQADTNRLSPDRRAAQARDDGPNAPPASVNMIPPAPADVPENVPVAGRGRGKPLQDQFQRRLAESAQQTVSPGMVAMPQPAYASASGYGYGRGEEEPIHLVPPGSNKRARSGGGKGMAAPAPEPAASFQVASLDFRANSSDLTAADRTSIAEVARLYRQTGGVVRVVGHAPALGYGDAVSQMMNGLEASMKRANAVARELAKRGVPASKIMVGADPAGAPVGDVGAQVYIDVI